MEFDQNHQDWAAINKHIRCQILWLILPFWWVQSDVWRCLGGTSDSRSGDDSVGIISKDLPCKVVTLVVTKANPMSSFLIRLRRESVFRFIFIHFVVDRFPERKIQKLTDIRDLSSQSLERGKASQGRGCCSIQETAYIQQT